MFSASGWGSASRPDSRLGETIERPETSKHHPYSRASDHPGPPPRRPTRRVPLVAAPVPTPTDPNFFICTVKASWLDGRHARLRQGHQRHGRRAKDRSPRRYPSPRDGRHRRRRRDPHGRTRPGGPLSRTKPPSTRATVDRAKIIRAVRRACSRLAWVHRICDAHTRHLLDHLLAPTSAPHRHHRHPYPSSARARRRWKYRSTPRRVHVAPVDARPRRRRRRRQRMRV